MEERNKKKATILIVVVIAIVLLVVIGATYAYFVAQNAEETNISTKVTTNTTDSLTFAIDKNLAITANADNFANGGNNLSDTSVITATLKANNNTNSATYNYDIYLDMGDNPFVYTTTDNKAELLLTITDPNGNSITTIDGLTYTTINGISGFDVTTTSGNIELITNYEISTTSTKVDNWQVTLTLINLDTDQNDNTGKTISGKLTIKKSKTFIAGDILTSSEYIGIGSHNYLFCGDSSCLVSNIADDDGSYPSSLTMSVPTDGYYQMCVQTTDSGLGGVYLNNEYLYTLDPPECYYAEGECFACTPINKYLTTTDVIKLNIDNGRVPEGMPILWFYLQKGTYE